MEGKGESKRTKTGGPPTLRALRYRVKEMHSKGFGGRAGNILEERRSCNVGPQDAQWRERAPFPTVVRCDKPINPEQYHIDRKV